MTARTVARARPSPSPSCSSRTLKQRILPRIVRYYIDRHMNTEPMRMVRYRTEIAYAAERCTDGRLFVRPDCRHAFTSRERSRWISYPIGVVFAPSPATVTCMITAGVSRTPSGSLCIRVGAATRSSPSSSRDNSHISGNAPILPQRCWALVQYGRDSGQCLSIAVGDGPVCRAGREDM
jgi:hypothetical protein